MLTNTIQQFSWNRVRVALVMFDKSEGYFLADGTLVLSFLFHQHEVWLLPDGRGLLYNPWNDNSQKYSLIMPHDIQDMVVALHKKHTQPIPIDMKSN